MSAALEQFWAEMDARYPTQQAVMASGKVALYQQLIWLPGACDKNRVFWRQWLKRYGFWDGGNP